MPNECIICLDDKDTIKVDCNNCTGIYAHDECLKEMVDRLGNKCPQCRDKLVDDSDSDSSMNSEEEAIYLQQVLERRRMYMSGSNNEIIDNRNFHLVIYAILIIFFGYILGTMIMFLCCMAISICDRDAETIPTNPFYVLIRFNIGFAFVLCLYCVFKKKINQIGIARSRRISNNINNEIHENNENIV